VVASRPVTSERPAYVASLAAVTKPGGTVYLLCFSADGPDAGPHPLTEHDLRAAFSADTGWTLAALEPDRVMTRLHDDNGAPAWLATVTRVASTAGVVLRPLRHD
jgi:hypothetical protein